jgi:hypothetical protein
VVAPRRGQSLGRGLADRFGTRLGGRSAEHVIRITESRPGCLKAAGRYREEQIKKRRRPRADGPKPHPPRGIGNGDLHL